ncbi:uroporphyrinogen-III C-methyltransferase [Simiduia agarivorans]|uniref:uroporphyrinogen-III C-methyltransferase n=1 Tax=Simiduia agarivorans (strain DSM 21679 / JCM 13881 / BCRC 17597 / SA1) TaxID=1117647 RepID=K4KH65_SIMAS|nr:uroporphyrinogen-III C-methyltransferase [Simiduia agarivorans]AFU98449.1 uroporphyrin-III C-methyltransferase [Simiduia agarivorans SA1 = DSM 21679]
MKASPSHRIQFLAGIKPRVSRAIGHVSLVGAGPGDAELLTLKAVKCLNAADIIFYDRLVSEDIRALFPRNTPAIYVGKAKDRHSIPQDELNRLLVETANLGLHVCRLKGGDAFVFGRGGEEMLELKKAGISVDVVPGITSGAGATAYAGIPLTHRGLTQGVSFVTAHGEKELHTNWEALAHSGHTLVFYMGLGSAQRIQNELLAAGMAAEKPVALIERGCSASQRVVTGDLAQLGALVAEHQIESPALIVVGDVVSLRDQLAWFEADAAGQANARYAEVASPFEQSKNKLSA